MIAAVAAATLATQIGLPIAMAAGYPEMELRRGGTNHEWPFAVEQGTLTCIEYQGQKVAIFSEPWRTDVPQEFGNMTLPRSVIVSANPMALLASIEDRALYLPFDSLETLIRRLAPFEELGRTLCDGDGAGEREL